ncbi:hypothetical protein [Desulfurobacterium atlanticum]|uniref:Uncharacterized protein n=1 Tax=Desulfurobacterium atlanticum TaxID=240169 RepID=A0A238YSV4_9BACT|nr:hypothetical protein [Desulfurobacterium atlanticum]SNR73673.1 hypothetical protein SAMN06265340_104132 [Desulfurobacterium atlanticum]
MRKLVVLTAVSAVMFSSCVGAVQEAVALYDSASALNKGYHSYKMVKSLKNAPPIFKDYDCVKVQTLIIPAEAGKAKELRDAFIDNFKYIVREYLKAAKLDNITVCDTDNCTCKGKTLVVQFLENGYSPNLFNRITIGGMLRGKLRYIDSESGKVLREENMEVAKDYKTLLQEIAMSVSTKAAQTALKLHPEENPEKLIDRLNKVKPIKPEYEKLFENSN